MQQVHGLGIFHNAGDTGLIYNNRGTSGDGAIGIHLVDSFSYNFENFWHPFVARSDQAAQPDVSRRDA